MKRFAAVWPALWLCCVSAFAYQAAPAQQPGAVPSVASGTVVTAPNIQATAIQAAAQNPPPAPPPMPAGYVVVSTTHIDQVANLAKVGIETAQKNEESLLRMLGIASGGIALVIGVLAFFGIKEFKDIKDKAKKLSEPLEALQSINISLTQVHEMSDILIRLFSFRHVNQQLNELVRKKSPDLRKAALDAIPEGKALLELSKSHYKTLTDAEKMHTAEREEGMSKQSERVLSYVAAVLAVIAMRAQLFNDAVMWAQESVEHNPRKYDDRYYNLACALARRNEGDDRVRALEILEEAFKRHAIAWREAWDDEDFEGIREGLAKSQFKDAELVKAHLAMQPVARPAVRRLRKKRA